MHLFFDATGEEREREAGSHSLLLNKWHVKEEKEDSNHIVLLYTINPSS